jgi:uncharacterized membrane protein (DUF2068 family)
MEQVRPLQPDPGSIRKRSVVGHGDSKRRPADGRLLRAIAVFKFFKSASLIALSVGAFRGLHQDLGSRLEHWLRAMRLDPGNRYVEMLLMRVSNLTPAQIKKLGLAGLIYAALFLIEGTGLWMRKRWGEWATVVITGMLIPVEIYEIFRRPGVGKVLVLILNAAVVGYLIYRIRTTDAKA